MKSPAASSVLTLTRWNSLTLSITRIDFRYDDPVILKLIIIEAGLLPDSVKSLILSLQLNRHKIM